MGLKINIAGNETDFSIVERQVETTAEGNQCVDFLLSNSQNRERINFSFPFDIPYPLPPNNSTVFVFKNSEFRTNDIIEFRIKKDLALLHNGNPSADGKVGYFFKLQTLLEESGADIFSRVPYSILYAFTCIEVILKNETNISLPPKKINDENIELVINNLYDSDVIFLVIDKDLLLNQKSFVIEKYLCSLYKLGFYLATQHDFAINVNSLTQIKDSFQEARRRTPRKYINAELSSKNIDLISSNSFYKKLLQDILIKKAEFPTFFIALFQVVELLKDDVLKQEIKKINSLGKTGYEYKNEISKISSDGMLIQKLFGQNYSKINSKNQEELTIHLESFFDKTETRKIDPQEENVTIIIRELKAFLASHATYKNEARKELYDSLTFFVKELDSKYDKKVKKDKMKFASQLYLFRNTLLHNYSRVILSTVDKELFDKIRMHFEYLIIDLIQTYKIDK